jgi:hypothetical protein
VKAVRKQLPPRKESNRLECMDGENDLKNKICQVYQIFQERDMEYTRGMMRQKRGGKERERREREREQGDKRKKDVTDEEEEGKRIRKESSLFLRDRERVS